MANPQPSQRIGEYVLDQRLGAGAFGEVWRAHHNTWVDHLVAIKIPTDANYLRQLRNEGAAVHGLQHPNIVRALGFDPYADPPYLTMEFVPGTSLRPLISSKLGLPDALAIMRQVLTGLAYAHAHGIVHRDLKPENILVHESAAKLGYSIDGVVKITDFGLGQAARRDAALTAGSIVYSASLNAPAARELAGTLDYMAPEQRTAGAAANPRADLYAAGVILYELLTGDKPAGTEVPSDQNKSVPAWLDDVFRHAYARLDKRYASADAFLAALSKGAPRISPPPIPASNGTNGHSATGCPNCHGRIRAGDQFCIHCGLRLAEFVPFCANCHAFLDRSHQFCIYCGAPVTNLPEHV